MTISKCLSCGAHINPQALRCEYCGAYPTVKPAEEQKTKGIRVAKINDHTLNTMLLSKSAMNIMVAPLIIFAVLWCGGAFFGGVASLSFGAGPMALVPFGMCLFGLSIFIPQIKKGLNLNSNQYKRMFYNGEYEKAYDLINEQRNKSQDELRKLTIIGFYRLRKFEEVKGHILNLEIIGSMPDMDVSRIAKVLEVSYNPMSHYINRQFRNINFNGFNNF